MDQAIVEYLRRTHGLRVGLTAAEQLRIELGSAWPIDDERTTEVRGLDVTNGMPRRMQINATHVREALVAPLEKIVETIRATLDSCSPDLISDLVDRGGGVVRRRRAVGRFGSLDYAPYRFAGRAWPRNRRRRSCRGTLICLEHLDTWRNFVESSDATF